jgi:hypothetical protein
MAIKYRNRLERDRPDENAAHISTGYLEHRSFTLIVGHPAEQVVLARRSPSPKFFSLSSI